MRETPIKVLQVVPRNPYGGIYRVVNDLVVSLGRDRDLDLAVAVLEDKHFGGEFAIQSKRVPCTEVKGNLLSRVVLLKKLAQGHDIVHLHGFTPWVVLALLMAGKKIVYTNHGLLGTGRKLRSYEYMKRTFIKLFLRYRVDLIVNISQYTEQRVVKEYKVPPGKNVVVYNCTRWTRSEPRFSAKGVITIGFHGRFVRFKRVDRLLEVAAEIGKEYPIKVILVGDGPLREDLIKRAKELAVPMEITGYQTHVEQLLRSFDIEIISSCGEPLGVAVLESIQAGLPTFVFADGGGCTEIFDKETEWFICKDEKEMGEKILSLMDHEVSKGVLRKLVKLQERVDRLFSPTQFAKGYATVYRKVAGR